MRAVREEGDGASRSLVPSMISMRKKRTPPLTRALPNDSWSAGETATTTTTTEERS